MVSSHGLCKRKEQSRMARLLGPGTCWRCRGRAEQRGRSLPGPSASLPQSCCPLTHARMEAKRVLLPVHPVSRLGSH